VPNWYEFFLNTQYQYLPSIERKTTYQDQSGMFKSPYKSNTGFH
jgi:hypothetical protein